MHFDCHIEVGRCFYSVPFQLVKQEVDVRVSAKTIECFHEGKLIALHPRQANKQGGYSTQAAHLPKHHQAQLEWSPQRLRRWAQEVGEQTHQLVNQMIESRKHPEMAYRSTLGLLNLVRRYSPQRVEKACELALQIGSPTRNSVASILQQELDKLPGVETTGENELPLHENIRGSEYYR